MTQELWLQSHPYLRPIAHLQTQVNIAAADIPSLGSPIPNWDDYADGFRAGVPFLLSPSFVLDLGSVARMLVAIIERLVSSSLPYKLAGECRTLLAELRSDANLPQHAIGWLLFHEACSTSCPGMLRYVGWTALARHLGPLLDGFARWRDEESWLRTYCPACGSPPAMGQLTGIESVRQRFLCCGCCGTRWQYRRTGCPFCENNDDRRLAVLAVEGEGGLRIESCKSCGGYVKTYAGSGAEDIFLADWTSIHLDIAARDLGLKRLAASLYEL